MAAIPAAIAWIGAGLGLSHVAPDLSPFGNKKENKNNNQYQNHPPVYHIQAGNQGLGLGSVMTAVFISGGVFIFYGAYKYFWGQNPLDSILPELEETSKAALEQIQKADENARARNQQMDENNRQRLLTLQADLQSEQRGNHEILSEQIHCLTQIALQTLTTITPGESQIAITSGGPGNEQAVAEVRDQRNGVLEFANRAQQAADEIADPSYHEKKRQEARGRIRAEIPNMPALTDGHNNNQQPGLNGPHDLSVPGQRRNARRNNANKGIMGNLLGGALGMFMKS